MVILCVCVCDIHILVFVKNTSRKTTARDERMPKMVLNASGWWCVCMNTNEHTGCLWSSHALNAIATPQANN